MKSLKKYVFSIIFGVGILAAVILIYANLVVLSYKQRGVTDLTDVPRHSVALVFGGGMKSATEMSDMQYDRVLAGVDLYKQHTVDKLLFTGDDGAFRANEIDAMRQLARAEGVAEGDILVDPHGYRTYLSCGRAKAWYGVTSTIAISQSFHLPRIRYFCEHFGIQTVGYAADRRDYHSWWLYHGRETLARLKGWWQVTVTQPFPR